MTALSPDAQHVAGRLAEVVAGNSDEVVSLVVPYQSQPGRIAAINTFDRVVAELRAAGWQLETRIDRAPNGEAYSIEPLSRPDPEDPPNQED